MPLTIYTGGAKCVDTHVEHLCHKYGYECVVFIPPCHPPAKSLVPSSHPINLQYLPRNYDLIKTASLVLTLVHVLGGTGWSVAIAQLLNKPLYVFDLDMEQWYWWNPTLQQYEPCDGMTEEQISLPTLQDKTAIVGTREEDAAVYPTLEALFQRS